MELVWDERPIGMSFWPQDVDAPAVAPRREDIRIRTADGALVRGVLWTPPTGEAWKTAVVLSHPRGDFSHHYACPLLAAAGYAVFGFATRYLNNDADCLHENCILDVVAAVEEMRSRGADQVILFGNSGGGSLMALAQAETKCGDAWIGCAAHPGEGVFMEQVIDPSVVDEADALSVNADLDMYDPKNGWRPWPEPCRYDPAWVARYRQAQRSRIERIDSRAREALAIAKQGRADARGAPAGSDDWRDGRRRGLYTPYMVTYRTLANPAYLDLSLEPDDRPMGSLFAFPDPFESNYSSFGLGRVMTPRGWLSTWSSISSPARLADTMPRVSCPTLILHPTADTEIRLSQARAIRDAAGAADTTYIELEGAPHYLEGHRVAAMEQVAAWIAERS